MLRKEDIEKIERYVNGQSDDKEKSWIESLFSKGESNDGLRNHLNEDWDMILKDSSIPGVDLNLLLDRVHHIIRKKEILLRQKPLQRFIRIYMKAAAILILPLLVAGGLLYNYMGNKDKLIADQLVSSMIYAPMGSRVSFNLPDGTTGMLNSGSHLSYSLPFANNRQVKLEGEAWFEVKKDKDHPFEINAGNSKVKVLGTSFNLSAYPSENYVEVVLQEGKVEFADKEHDKKITLLPSERLVFQNGDINKTKTDPAKYNAWTEGKLVFRGDPMSEVARRIERWYNVKVTLADSELVKYSFRGTFEDDTIDEVLKFLAMTSPISYTIAPRELMPDGTFKKEEITIFKKTLNINPKTKKL